VQLLYVLVAIAHLIGNHFKPLVLNIPFIEQFYVVRLVDVMNLTDYFVLEVNILVNQAVNLIFKVDDPDNPLFICCL
jgi:hypothetical protein